MNKKDQLLIRVLEKEGKLSSRKLAMKTMLPVSTVHRRVAKLEKDGIIKGYRAIINYEKTDKPIPALIFLNLSETNKKENAASLEKIKNEIRKNQEIFEVLQVQGGKWDLILKARFENLKGTNQLAEKLRKIQGIEEVRAAIVTEETLF
ncbi:MAG: Lrp/AsnC family transcriptional regulator [Candidatus Aenigmarchaeota archaeon]|nr:Lrp/AsnC family transcriptional regulator [Candidatus Aenigmarchaeota archaeon]PIV69509.1 MAG: hypothetical protein COS07_00535 [Candidatus Aenigmarchaeota archaeon CG01_land_8_20_14_3_00_37_9]PIY36350.1 MAG: hypothetical protein COZ04_00650 [Candidatus Aenigmarchaeota archaeon CG_4_10_14_3_um_filter_37_21]